MATTKIHPLSGKNTKTELDVFEVPGSQVAITGNSEHWALPATSITTSSKRIEFIIPPMQDMIDPHNIWVYLDFKVRKRSGGTVSDLGSTTTTTQAVAATTTTPAIPAKTTVTYDHVCPSPYFLNTLFKEVEVIMGNSTRITPQSSPYHYKSYFDTLFFSTREAKDTYLKGAMWMDDDDRFELVKESKLVSLVGRLHVDLFRQGKLLLPFIPIRINLSLNPESVIFVSKTGTKRIAVSEPVLEIQDCKLCIRKFNVDSSVLNGIDKGLGINDAKYFFTRGVVDTRHIPSNVTKHTIDNVYKGILPRLFIVGFIKNADYNGTLDSSAFEFGHNNLTSIIAYKGSTMINGKPFTPDFANDNYTREYVDLYRALCQDTTEPMMNISYEDFKSKCCFFAFNLTPDASNLGGDDGLVNLLESDTVRIELAWSGALTHPLNMITYALYDNHISISMDREVKHDY